jgi:hypothetical protein
MLPKALRPYYELCKAVTSFLTVLVPLLEKWQPVLPSLSSASGVPVDRSVRLFSCHCGWLLDRPAHCERTLRRLELSVAVFGVLTVQLTGLPHIAWAQRPLYVLIFAFFSLSTSAFLAYSARKSAASIDWQEPA